MLARPAMRSSWLPAALARPMRTPWLSAFDLPVVCRYPSPPPPPPSECPATLQTPAVVTICHDTTFACDCHRWHE